MQLDLSGKIVPARSAAGGADQPDSVLAVAAACPPDYEPPPLHKKPNGPNREGRVQRLREAQVLDSSLSVSEVANAVGFDDPKYFSRVFSDEFGISPGNFRQLARV